MPCRPSTRPSRNTPTPDHAPRPADAARAVRGTPDGHVLDELQEPGEAGDLLRLGPHRLPTGDFPCSAAGPPSCPPTTAPPNSNAASTSCSPAWPPPCPQAKPAAPVLPQGQRPARPRPGPAGRSRRGAQRPPAQDPRLGHPGRPAGRAAGGRQAASGAARMGSWPTCTGRPNIGGRPRRQPSSPRPASEGSKPSLQDRLGPVPVRGNTDRGHMTVTCGERTCQITW
jgi:hypothetical protein